MVKLRKQRRKKVFNHNRNRKRMRNKQFSEGSINCKEIKTAWDSKKSLQTNLKEMGLCYDPNSTFKISASRKEKITRAKKLANLDSGSEDDWNVEDVSASDATNKSANQDKKHVLESLMEDASAPRVKMFRLPKGQVEFLTHMLTKHGFDYKAMVRDKKNYNQETWKQLRAKIHRFKSIPEQYEQFLAKASPATLQKLKEVEMEDDD